MPLHGCLVLSFQMIEVCDRQVSRYFAVTHTSILWTKGGANKVEEVGPEHQKREEGHAGRGDLCRFHSVPLPPSPLDHCPPEDPGRAGFHPFFGASGETAVFSLVWLFALLK